MSLRRTATFYLGLFPLVILLWAWADSITHSVLRAQPVGERRLLAFHSMNSRFEFRSVAVSANQPGPPASSLLPPHVAHGFQQRSEIDPTMRLTWFPAPKRIAESIPTGTVTFNHSGIILPYWLMVACYLPPWLALSFWHARRKQKRHQQSLPSPAQPQTDL